MEWEKFPTVGKWIADKGPFSATVSFLNPVQKDTGYILDIGTFKELGSLQSYWGFSKASDARRYGSKLLSLLGNRFGDLDEEFILSEPGSNLIREVLPSGGLIDNEDL